MGRLLLPSGAGRCYVSRFLKACLMIILLMSLFSSWLYWDAFVTSRESAKQLSVQLLRDFPGKTFLKYWEDQGGGTTAEGKAGPEAETITGRLVANSPPVFHDRLFTPLLETFRNPDGLERRRKSFRNGDVPKVVAYIDKAFLKSKWYVAHSRDIQGGHCPCLVQSRRVCEDRGRCVDPMKSIPSREQLLHALQPRDPTQPWIMFEAETHFIASTKYNVNYRTLNGVFNRTMYYRRGKATTPASCRGTGSGGPCGESERDGANRSGLHLQLQSAQQSSSLHQRTAEKKHHRRRVREVREAEVREIALRRARVPGGQRPVFASRGREIPVLPGLRERHLRRLCHGEAVHMMFYPLVPVVLGGANYDDLLPPNSYIDARQYTPLELAKRLQHLAEHPQEYQTYLEWRKYYQPSTVGGSRGPVRPVQTTPRRSLLRGETRLKIFTTGL
ncbi:uncharacterized protein LOC134788699 [Penaeus indicus]|uniref:uncharacterized protein LOC134788699 n=1 Tax=Penaeus indicus TaxID=29960 RepID=UPI00300CA876